MTSTLELPSPVAARLRRPSWRDPRLLAGIALVAGSVALGSWVVSSAQPTMPVYVARGALTPGEPLGPDTVMVQQVRLPAAEAERYVVADGPLDRDLVALRVVGDGELVPRSAVGDAADLDVRPVAVVVADAQPQGLDAGSQVDLWFVPPADTADTDDRGDDAAAPRPLAEALTVAEVDRPEGGFTVGAATTVHVLVPSQDLADVLAATTSDGTVSLVLVPGTGGSP